MKTIQLVGHADFRFIIIWSSYSVKSHYFNIIFNLLRLLSGISIINIAFTIQLFQLSQRSAERRGGPSTTARVLCKTRGKPSTWFRGTRRVEQLLETRTQADKHTKRHQKTFKNEIFCSFQKFEKTIQELSNWTRMQTFVS